MGLMDNNRIFTLLKISRSREKQDLAKDNKQHRKYGRKTVLSLFILGLIWFTLFLTLLVGDPLIMALKWYTRVTNGSFVHELMIKEIEGIHVSANLFNITNAQEFLDGTDYKLKVKEVGPFTYREMRSNIDVEIDSAAEIVRYTPNIRMEFIPEESIGDPEKINVTMPNIPMLGMTSKMSEYGLVTRYGFNQMTTLLSSKPIININAHNYLWGYEEPLVSIGHTLIPGSVHFEKMGILDRLYDKKRRNRIEISIANNEKFMIKRLNGHKKLAMEETGDPDACEFCNTFENTYEGVGFRPDLPPGFPIRLFKNGLCRILDLVYEGTKPTFYGGEALMYSFSDNFYKLSPNDTYTGILPLSDCFYDLPLAFSKPHFEDVDPKVYERIEGIHPDPEKYKGWVAVDPRIGMTLETIFSIQLNLVIADVSTNAQAKSFANMIIPICNIKIEQPPLPEESYFFLAGVYGLGPKIILAAEIILALLIFICWGFFARAVYVNHIAEDRPVMSFPMKMPSKEINANDIEVALTTEQKEKLFQET